MSFEFICMVDFCNQAEYATDDLPRPHKKKKMFNTVWTSTVGIWQHQKDVKLHNIRRASRAVSFRQHGLRAGPGRPAVEN